MSERVDAKKKVELMKQLRQTHKEGIDRVQAQFKEQREVRRQVTQAMGNTPKTVPEVAEASGLPADVVLWHITAMRQYGLVAEVGMSEEYYTYQLIEETKK